MSTRLAAVLRGPNGAKNVFVSTNGLERKIDPDEPNQHRMFRLLRAGIPPYFRELPGPWIDYFRVDCAVSADLNGDDLDDLILCNEAGKARVYVQNSKERFRELELPDSDTVRGWSSVRVAKVTTSIGSGSSERRPDLVVVGRRRGPKHYVRIFKARRSAPYFQFSKPHLTRVLPHYAPDVEVLDVDGDGHADVYVSQNDRYARPDSYCGTEGRPVWKFFGGERYPPANWTPPIDEANDVLFLGGVVVKSSTKKRKKKSRTKNKKKIRTYGFKKRVVMRDTGRGCGGLVAKFGTDGRTLLRSDADKDHAGFHYVLEWKRDGERSAAAAAGGGWDGEAA